LGGRDLARPVVGGAAAAFHRAFRYGIEDTQGRHQFAAGEDLDFDLAARGFAHAFGKSLRTGLQDGQIRRPGRDHFPLISLFGLDRRGCRFGLFLFLLGTTGQAGTCGHGTGGRQTCFSQKITSFHTFLLLCCGLKETIRASS